MRYIRNKKKKEMVIAAIVLGGILALILLTIVVMIDNSHRVDFEDEVMAEMISKSAHVKSINRVRDKDLKEVEVLNIGYTGYYDTLVDIEKCPNLKTLIVGHPDTTMSDYYFWEKEVPGPESKERIKQIEKELKSILEKCPNLTTIYISNEEKNCELSNLEFLRKGKKLKCIGLYCQSNIDYSPISECRKLEFLSLYDCDISDLEMISELENLGSLVLTGTKVSEATDILKLKKLNFFRIADTPLAENKEQLELIQKKFPELNIETDY